MGAITLLLCAVAGAAMTSEWVGDFDYKTWLGEDFDEHLADIDCDCKHCDVYRKDQEATTYHTMIKDGDKGHTFRRGLMPCGKQRVPQLDVKEAPADSGLREVELYHPSCCGLELEESDESVCELCGFDAVVMNSCLTAHENNQQSRRYHPSPARPPWHAPPGPRAWSGRCQVARPDPSAAFYDDHARTWRHHPNFWGFPKGRSMF
jgi:hypothetical protein